LWAASSDYTRDVVIGPKVIEKSSESLRKIRNTARFLLGNLHDFDPHTDCVNTVEELSPVDRLFLHRTALFLDQAQMHYDAFHFRKVIECLQQYVSNDLSSFYFEIVKDTLYTSGKSSAQRRSVQTTLHYALGALLAVTGPIIPFTAEDIYQYHAVAVQRLREERNIQTNHSIACDEMIQRDKVFEKVPGESIFRVLSWTKKDTNGGEQNDCNSTSTSADADTDTDTHTSDLTCWPVLDTSTFLNPSIEEAWSPVNQLRERVQHTLEIARKDKKEVGSSLDAKVELVGPWSEAKGALDDLTCFGPLSNIFVVSQVSLIDIKDAEQVDNDACIAYETTTVALKNDKTIEVGIRIVKPSGTKCPRCWKFATTVYGDIDTPECGC